ncbi:MAG: FAD-dependent oxidoreductase [Actinomycetota bacterium]|nr:FAD-dependent oxidoreductase [Actinomycetota bacterium]
MNTQLPPSSQSLWIDDESSRHPKLDGDRRADVVVVGAGIAGLTTAALLAREGVEVVVLEAGTLGRGTSGHTTAKISALQGTTLSQLDRKHGRRVTAAYAEAQRSATAWISGRVTQRDVDCQFERRPAWTYTTDPSNVADVEREAEVAAAVGLDAALGTPTELPFEVAAAVTLPDQGQFDPYPYLLDLADEVATSSGCSVHELSRVVRVGAKEVSTSNGKVRADHVVITTLLPITDRGLFFARAEPKRSYLLAVEIDGPAPQGMYLSADEPKRSLRSAHDPDQPDDTDRELMLVGGGGHVTGRKAHTLAQYEELARWAGEHFEVAAVRRRWSAQDYTTADMLPFVGHAWAPLGGPLIATGLAKWGMTNGTAAAMVLADRILGRTDGPSAPWAATWDPARLNRQVVERGAKLNGEVAFQMVNGWVRPGDDPGERRPSVHRRHGRPVADVTSGGGEGAPCQLSLVCTHLGGIVRWNDAERSWDCPLHGSRFSETGVVLDGPAVKALDGGPDADAR